MTFHTLFFRLHEGNFDVAPTYKSIQLTHTRPGKPAGPGFWMEKAVDYQYYYEINILITAYIIDEKIMHPIL